MSSTVKPKLPLDANHPRLVLGSASTPKSNGYTIAPTKYISPPISGQRGQTTSILGGQHMSQGFGGGSPSMGGSTSVQPIQTPFRSTYHPSSASIRPSPAYHTAPSYHTPAPNGNTFSGTVYTRGGFPPASPYEAPSSYTPRNIGPLFNGGRSDHPSTGGGPRTIQVNPVTAPVKYVSQASPVKYVSQAAMGGRYGHPSGVENAYSTRVAPAAIPEAFNTYGAPPPATFARGLTPSPEAPPKKKKKRKQGSEGRRSPVGAAPTSWMKFLGCDSDTRRAQPKPVNRSRGIDTKDPILRRISDDSMRWDAVSSPSFMGVNRRSGAPCPHNEDDGQAIQLRDLFPCLGDIFDACGCPKPKSKARMRAPASGGPKLETLCLECGHVLDQQQLPKSMMPSMDRYTMPAMHHRGGHESGDVYEPPEDLPTYSGYKEWMYPDNEYPARKPSLYPLPHFNPGPARALRTRPGEREVGHYDNDGFDLDGEGRVSLPVFGNP
eukprot:GHVO01050409.1.p1 GENE.GHVO01050409.1~~GHVO01050409.1.p1  ORF type:complete len:492 (-),score=114.52 GHVO01050409.1:144-1619(-)